MPCEDFRGSAGRAELLLFKRHQLSCFKFAGTIVGVEPCGLCSKFELRDSQICGVLHCNAPFVNEYRAPHGLSLGISTSLRPPPLENLPPRESVSRRRVENDRSSQIRFHFSDTWKSAITAVCCITAQTKLLRLKSGASEQHDRRKNYCSCACCDSVAASANCESEPWEVVRRYSPFFFTGSHVLFVASRSVMQLVHVL